MRTFVHAVPPKGRSASARERSAQPVMEAALRLLSRRARSESEMRRALEGRGFSAPVVGRVLGRLRELGYIDDRKFAADWSERLQERGFGSLRIQDQLQRLGVDEALASGVIPEGKEERKVARRLLESRYGVDAMRDRKYHGRAYRLLCARGFPEGVVEDLLGPWGE